MKSKHQEIADAWVECSKAWQERDEAVEQLAAVTAERDALKNMPPLMSTSEACRVHHFQCCHACDRADCGDNQTPSIVALRAERDALAAQLAALRRRLADAVTCTAYPDGHILMANVPSGNYAIVRLEDGE